MILQIRLSSIVSYRGQDNNPRTCEYLRPFDSPHRVFGVIEDCQFPDAKGAKSKMRQLRLGFVRSKPLLLVLALLGVLFYSPSWNNYFVSDDYHFLGRIDFPHSGQYFAKSWGYGNEYRPLLPFSYSIDAALSKEHPVGYHVTNTLLHVAIAILAGLSLHALGLSASASVLATVLFFINPVAHESVLWIAGRPVLLGALFALLAVWAFAKFNQKNSLLYYSLSQASFLLALLSYEGAVIVPFVLAILVLSRFGIESKASTLMRLIPYFVLLLAYVLFWNKLFGGTITRFPVESSLLGAARSFGALLKRVFIGSSMGVPLVFYILLFLNFLRTTNGRRLCALMIALMIAAYLPFFIVHGYADRFAYLASIPASALLASMILSVNLGKFRTLLVGVLITVLIAYYGYSMQRRIVEWKEAGDIATQITSGIKRLRPSLPSEATIYVINVPEMHKNAYVFITGLEPAIQRIYNRSSLRILMNTLPSSNKSGNIFLFRYANGSIEEIVR
jgi:hypothetical protein